MKKLIYIITFFVTVLNQKVFAQGTLPEINCEGLPGCDIQGTDVIEKVSANIIAQLIQYVAVFAVIALMISGVMYMLSSGDEEKTKKARTWIIWSVVAVLLSISAYYIVNTLNEFNI